MATCNKNAIKRINIEKWLQRPIYGTSDEYSGRKGFPKVLPKAVLKHLREKVAFFVTVNLGMIYIKA